MPTLQQSNKENFIKKATIKHSSFFDYSLVDYINSKTKVKIICPIHGIFEQQPDNHLFGQGCPKCKSEKNKLSSEEFILKAKEIHKDKYDYSLINYQHSQKAVTIICPKHGKFSQIPNSHLMGKGCIKCAKEQNTSSAKEFIEKALTIHGDKYDYSKVNYINASTKVTIICPIHGAFLQRPSHHLNGKRCPICSFDSKRFNKEYFILKAKEIHGDKYDYSLVKYKNKETKVKIICPVHGVFEQSYSTHISQLCGCPRCSKKISFGEKEVLCYIKTIYSGTILTNDRTIIAPKELDIFLPERNIAIEYNGIYWHNIREEESPGYHKLKQSLCNDKGILLINITDKDWKDNKESIKLKLKQII